ncbi:MAG: protein-glutamate O-methyltransferase CheR [Chloroflexota bacterium]
MEDKVYFQIRDLIKKIMKIDLTNYKDEQMKRRLDSWLVRSHKNNWDEYFSLVTSDADEKEKFRNYLTINVTEFFRDLNRWDTLRQEVIPYLINTPSDHYKTEGLKIWSAGCSIGTEPYTLGMIMNETFSKQPFSILATDLDREALKRAKAGGPYSQDDIRNLTPVQLQKFLEPEKPYKVKDTLKKNIRFQEQDLFADKFDPGFDLIVCRNVVIYFTAEAKTVLYTKFHNALRPGGVLFLGGTEMISGPKEIGFQNFGISFYKKI